MTTYRTLFSSEHVIQNRESTSRVRVCESRGYSNTTETTQQQNNHNTCRLLSRKLGSFIEISKQIELRALKGNWSLGLARAITSNIIAIPGKGINHFW